MKRYLPAVQIVSTLSRLSPLHLALALGQNVPTIQVHRTRQGSERKPILKPAGHFVSEGAQ